MNILVVGGGGREHAIIKKIKENKTVEKIYALPGNGGISYDAVCVDIKATDLDKIVEFAKTHDIDFAVIGPDDPLAAGIVDRLLAIDIPTFGPTAKAAIIEGSKVFSKELMKKYKIPTADYNVFDSAKKAFSYIKKNDVYPIVIKADGLALGKGVIIAQNQNEAENAITSIMEERIFGDSGNRIVIEEFLTGPEISVLAFTDSKTLIPMVSSMDHKQALDGDQGLNTGGMGAIAPNPNYTEEVAKQCTEEIFIPTMAAMNNEGRPFKGCLYFGLMLTEDGPKVIEYNCRFGDPEAQVVLPLLQTDLLSIMRAVAEERLSEVAVDFNKGSACCLVASSGGYPEAYETGLPISGLVNGALDGVYIFHAGTKLTDKGLVTSGGRVLGVTSISDDLEKAIKESYNKLEQIQFKDMHYRTDIGQRALRARGL